MYTPSQHAHHQLWSVGALMDPTFLRQAVHDEEEPALAHDMAPTSWPRLRSAMDSLVRAWHGRKDD